MNLFYALRDIEQAFAALAGEVERLRWSNDHAVVHGPVTDVDPKKQLCRIQIGEDEEGKPVLSPWVAYGQIAGTRKVHSPPSKGQQLTMVAPNGDHQQGFLLPFTWSENNPSPSEKGDEDIDLRGKTRRTQRDADLKQEVDGVTRQYTKQSKKTTIHKAEKNAKKVDDANPWEGNQGEALHVSALDKDGGYALTINVQGQEHKIKVHPKNGIEHSFNKGKHKITIDKNAITNSFADGKHKTVISQSGIKHTVDDGQHEISIGSTGAAGMLDGQIGDVLGGDLANMLGAELSGLLNSGALAGLLSGGNLSGLLGGQLSGLLGNGLVTQLTGEMIGLNDVGQLAGIIGGASGGVGGLLSGQLGGMLGGNLGAFTGQLSGLLSGGGLGGLLSGGGLGSLLGGNLSGILGNAMMGMLQSQLGNMLDSGALQQALLGGIHHKSSNRVTIESPQIQHMGDIKVIGSLLATKSVQSAAGFLGNLQGIASGIGFGGGLTPPTNW